MEQRKLNRRDFLRLSAAAASGTIAAACAPAATLAPKAEEPKAVEEEKPAAEKPEAPAEKAKVRFQDWGGDYGTMVEEKAIPAFHEDHPNIEVIYEPYASGWIEKTIAAMVAGTAPDILHAWVPVFRQFVDRGQMIDLSPLVEADLTDEILSDFYDFQLEAGILPGTQFRFQLPKHVFVLMVEYNKDAFDEAGVDYPAKDWDHDDYAETLMALTKKTDDGTVEQFGGYIPAWSWDRLWPHLRSFGGHYADPDDRAKCLMDTPESQEGFEWVRARMWDDNSLAQQLQVEKQSEHDVFVAGTCVTAEGITTHLDRVANDTEFAWDIGWLPRGPVQRAGYGGGNGWGVYKGVEERGNLDAVWEFLKFLTGPVFQKLILEPTSRTPIPMRKSLFDEFVRQNRQRTPELEGVNLESLLDMMVEEDFLKADPDTFKNQAAAEEIINPVLEQVFITGTAPVSALGDIRPEVEAVQTK